MDTTTAILTSAIGGSVTTLLGMLLNNHLTNRRELRRLSIETLERFRDRYDSDPNIRTAQDKLDKGTPLDESELEHYLDFLEEVGLYTYKGFVDEDLVDEILGDGIIEAYEDKQIMQHVASIRFDTRDDTYWKYFEQLARRLSKQERTRRGT